MKRILVTGGCGFVGACVVRQLVKEGRNVAVLMRPSTDARRIADVLGQCTVISCDLARIEDARAPLVQFSPEAVLHLAWGGVKGADRNSTTQIDNVCASINLYKLADEIGCRSFVGLGSQAEYGVLSGRIAEDAPARPTTAYGAAKLATGVALERHAAASGRHFAWLRLFSSYGPDDDPSWLVPYLINTLLARERPKLTKGEQVWDYMHVDDVAGGIIAALNAQARGVFNLGSGRGYPLRDIITLIRDAVDPSLPLGFGEVPYRPDQVMHLESDNSALCRVAGWRPRIALEDGIVATVASHRKAVLPSNRDSHIS